MVSRYVLKDWEITDTAIRRLLENYHLYGHLYDNAGEIKDIYKAYHIGGDSMVYDGDERLLDEIPEINCQSNDKYLYIHRSTVLGAIDSGKLINASVDEIVEEFLASSMDKLVAMLRRGLNYANDYPIPKTVDDAEVRQMIALTWRFMAVYDVPYFSCPDSWESDGSLCLVRNRLKKQKEIVEIIKLGLNPWEMEEEEDDWF